MRKSSNPFNRRNFIKYSTTLATGLTAFSILPQHAWSKEPENEDINVIGPKKGFSP